MKNRAAHVVGVLLGNAGTTDIVGAHLVVPRAERAATPITSHPSDLRRL